MSPIIAKVIGEADITGGQFMASGPDLEATLQRVRNYWFKERASSGVPPEQIEQSWQEVEPRFRALFVNPDPTVARGMRHKPSHTTAYQYTHSQAQ